MTALRLARAATGRERVLKFAGAYHGHVDGLLAQAGSGLATQALPSSLGVPASATANTVVIPWNDAAALGAATAEHDFAAILAEGIPANMGLVPAPEEFIELLRSQADANGALLVLDEVISGFRVARGGAQELYGVQADITIMGKILGGGLPAGAIGGRAELLNMLAPAGGVYQAGTLSGNPLAVAAGLATLELLDEQAYLRLAAITEHLVQGLREAAGDYPVQIVSRQGLLTVFFSGRPVHNLADAQACDLDAYGAWCRGLLGARRLPAPVSVRGLVSLPRAHARAHRAHGASRPRRVQGASVKMTSDGLPVQTGQPLRGQHGGGRQAGAPSLQRLADLIRAQGGLMAGLLPAGAAPVNGHSPAQVAAAGPRAGEDAGEYELLVEAIYEGYLLHYGPLRLLRPVEVDLGLLAGDQLYALGLSRLVALGDLVAVAELADVISLTALAHGAGDGELAGAIWDAGARAVGWGPSAEHAQAKALARAGSPRALSALRAVANRDR